MSTYGSSEYAERSAVSSTCSVLATGLENRTYHENLLVTQITPVILRDSKCLYTDFPLTKDLWSEDPDLEILSLFPQVRSYYNSIQVN